MQTLADGLNPALTLNLLRWCVQVQQMAVRCLQRNLRALRFVSKWSWWKLFCRVRPLLDVNMDNERLRAKEVHTNTHTQRQKCFQLLFKRGFITVSLCQDEISALRRRLEKSEKERNELRQTADGLETKV